MEMFGRKLIKWYLKNQRKLPWRETKDPYRIWLSEIIMQQTRVSQGLEYYRKFVSNFPDVFSLTAAPETKVYKLWQGLGYYNRAQNLMQAARTIANEYQGQFPETKEELMKIKGIGPYTAAAIASIAFGKPDPVVDGNVFRVLSRVFGIDTPIDTAKGKKEFTSLAGRLMKGQSPGDFNQALMEFGAVWCKPRNPDCDHCIFFEECYARKNNIVSQLPVKKPKTRIKDRFFYYMVAQTKNGVILMKKRGPDDIWKNLYDFPVIVTNERTKPLENLIALFEKISFNDMIYTIKHISNEYIHLLTHQRIHAVFIRLIVENFPENTPENDLLLINKNDIEKYPVPRLVEQYLQDQKLIKH